MKRILPALSIIVFLTSLNVYAQLPTLTIVNKSERHMTTKVMKGTEKKSTLYGIVYINPKGQEIITISEKGRYFTKTMAILVNEDTLQNDSIYSRGQPFEIVISNRGYNNITMTFTVKESKKPTVQGVIPITRKEYEKD